jgi:hypothetical protein
MPGERRWIVLMPDGGHISIGRHTDPSDDEIEAVAGKLRRAGTGGWRREGGGFRCQTCELVGCCGGADTEMDAVGTAI